MTNLIELRNIKKIFKKSEKKELLVLDQINFNIHEGEIIALLGRSGSGKSTLLRIIAGLTKPTAGEVRYYEKPVLEPAQGIAMVFQHFALMPWLTILENVSLGLEALGVSKKESRQRALKAIDLIGLDGFESAYPKELSGGMQQRVGIARALVVEPKLLLMDEAFSALDILTAENLRDDLLDLWTKSEFKKNSILLVTHNIEEAVAFADRIIVMDYNPGRVRSILHIDLPHPRNSGSKKFQGYVELIYKLMTKTTKAEIIDIGYRIPEAPVTKLMGLVDQIGEVQKAHKTIDLPTIADDLLLDIDELLSLTEILKLLQFIKETPEGNIELTEAGLQFEKADILLRKKIFSTHLLIYIPLTKHIYTKIHDEPSRRISKAQILKDLSAYLSEEEAQRVINVAIEWGRYAELFAYDDNAEELNLENPI
ncbi:MAG: nitrate/sulfonate/bicarbonate ABC transporter ATP-binding protein [Gammaproteobacteria bacterium]|nr:nitrate/sulfonate/bicarbonate ABC transporter ATP-binding protein [Gammaproteobacteria bacterium]